MALRTPLSVTPHLYMGDSTGRPLDMGTVYFGEPDKDPEFYPINLFSDDALTLPLAQPVHTKGGYLYDKGDMVEPHAKELIYSVKVLDSYGRKVFYKGAMMRNSWNDDVIEQINTAIIESQAEAQAIFGNAATDVKNKAIATVNDAINNTAVEGGVLADTFVTVTPNGTGMVARTQRDVNSDTVHVKDFGAKCDGVTDDTLALQKACDYAQDKPVVLHLSGHLYITDQINLERRIFIEGNFCNITFDNAEVDVDGDAKKGLISLGRKYSLQMNGSEINRIKVKHVQQIPNQHTIIADGIYVLDLILKDILVNDSTGCILWLKGKHNPAESFKIISNAGFNKTVAQWTTMTSPIETNIRGLYEAAKANGYTDDFVTFKGKMRGEIAYTEDTKIKGWRVYYPGFHNGVWTRLRGWNIGGIIGQAESARTWHFGATLEGLNLEVKTNTVSMQPIMVNLAGFNKTTANNTIIEGRTDIQIESGVYFDGSATVNNLYSETGGAGVKYLYEVNAYNSSVNVNLPRRNREEKIKLNGQSAHILTGHGLSGSVDAAYLIETSNGATYTVAAGSFYSSQPFDAATAHVHTKDIGTVDINNISTTSGITYSHNPLVKIPIDIFKINKELGHGVANGIMLSSNNTVEIRGFTSSEFTPTIKEEANFGRFVRLTPTEDSTIARMTLFFHNLGRYVGAQVTVGIRLRVNSSIVPTGEFKLFDSLASGGVPTTTSAFNGIVLPAAAISNGFGTVESSNSNFTGRFGEWVDGYAMFKIGSSEEIVQRLMRFTDLSIFGEGLSIDIADIQVQLGKELPSLTFGQAGPRTWSGTTKPTTGHYYVGDTVINTGTDKTIASWVCNKAGEAATWVATPANISGSTASRPTGLDAGDAGRMYFDTTLNKPVYWSGTSWVSSDGEVV